MKKKKAKAKRRTRCNSLPRVLVEKPEPETKRASCAVKACPFPALHEGFCRQHQPKNQLAPFSLLGSSLGAESLEGC